MLLQTGARQAGSYVVQKPNQTGPPDASIVSQLRLAEAFGVTDALDALRKQVGGPGAA